MDREYDVEPSVDGHEVDRLLARLDTEQLAAVTAPVGRVLVIAGAGSGKTRVLTTRIAYRIASGTAQTPHVVAFTFTRQAASELQRRLAQMGVGRELVAGTFHGVAYRILRRRWDDQGRSDAPTLVTNRVEVLTELLNGDRRVAAQVVPEVEWARARLVEPAGYATAAARSARSPELGLERVAEIYTSFEAYKKRKRILDFDDLLSRCIVELRRPGIADAVAWWHRHLHVDEFQDINPLQFAFLETLRNGGEDVFTVGDPAQAIYGWNGADAGLLNSLEESDPSPIVIRLSTNFRSAPEIVAAADRVLAANHMAEQHVAAREMSGQVVASAATDEVVEAREVVRLAQRLRTPGAPWRSVAVLARTHALLRDIAAAFAGAGIPTRVVTRAGNSDMSPAQAAFMRAARSAASTTELHALAADLAWPAGDEDDEDDARDERDEARTIVDPRTALQAVRDFEQSGGGSGSAFVAWTALQGTGDTPIDAVELVTMHAAKGREWPVVIVAGLDKVAFPAPGGPRSPARAEEARLLYVALTRAEDRLAVTWAEQRGGRPAGRSPLLPDLNAAPLPDADTPFVLERLPRHEPPVVDPVLAALTAWRTRAANAASVPASFVLEDEALRAVASARPASLDELVPIIGPLAVRQFGQRLLTVIAEASGRVSAG